jgi:hypothetical protein
MNIFFIASIHGKGKYGENYNSIVSYLNDLGHKVVSDHVLKVTAKDIDEWNEDKDVEFHKQVLDGIKKSDLVIVEMSHASTSVGYLVSVAVESGKPAIAFYSGKDVPHLLATLEKNDKFQLIKYSEVIELQKEIPLLISYATEQMDTRFNFFISPRIGNYLDWIAKKKKTPRAVYLRKLIEKEMENNNEYSKS